MKLYEIDEQLAQCFDQETGELIMPEVFEQLSMAREEKIEGILLYLKDTKAEAEAIAAEIKSLTARKKAAESRAEGLKSYIKYVLAGEKFKTARVAVSYRSVDAAELVEGVSEEVFREWAKANRDDLLTYKEPEISKTALKEALMNGDDIPGAHIVNKQAIIIK